MDISPEERRLGTARLLGQLMQAHNAVSIGLHARLLKAYAAKYDRVMAGFLAVAVVNEVFSNEPTNEEGRAFTETFPHIVHRELVALGDDWDLRIVLTKAIRAGAMIHFLLDDPPLVGFDAIQKLLRLGILIPESPMPTLEGFMATASEFHDTRPTNL